MKPVFRGPAVLAIALVLGACSGDPTDNFRGNATNITASPTSLFIVRGETKEVIVEVVDDQGNPLEQDVAVSGGAGLTITLDPDYLGTTTTDGQLKYEKAFNVTANELTSTTFTVTSGDLSREIAVRVTPGAADVPLVTVASTGPNAGDPTVLTVPAPFQFAADSAVTFDAGPGIIIARSADGRSLTVLPPPGTTSTGAVFLAPDYLAEGVVASATDVPVTISPTVTALPGTGSPSTAPNFDAPAAGGVTAFYDAGTFTAPDITADGGVAGQYYRLTVAADGDYTITTNWDNDADIDQLLCRDATCSDGGEFLGSGTDQPEEGTVTLTAGTYYIAVILFEAGATPVGYIATTISNP